VPTPDTPAAATPATPAIPATPSPVGATVAERLRLDGRVAIVTGASKGIGEAAARALAAFGARVVVSSRKQEAVEAVAAAIRAAGGEAAAVAAHAGDPAQLARLVDATVARYGAVDVVVNNAATNPVYGPVAEQGAEAFAKIMAVNVQGPLELARLAYPHMRARGGGSVVNIASVGGLTPEPGLGLYSVSKAALVSLTKVLAAEWGPDGVRANVVCPGLIRTRFSEALWGDARVVAQMMAQQPIKRVGEPEDVAGLILFLASDAAAYCTGGVYTADGGYTI
jgi:NAD(P)-dependent dehydrogenase (short-subunit alcohol dehydrogenase family)